MDEQRRDDRIIVLKTASIRDRGDKPEIHCAVLNVSESGACLLIPNDVALPTRFELAVDRDATSRPCAIVWREGPRIGVLFLQEAENETHGV